MYVFSIIRMYIRVGCKSFPPLTWIENWNMWSKTKDQRHQNMIWIFRGHNRRGFKIFLSPSEILKCHLLSFTMNILHSLCTCCYFMMGCYLWNSIDLFPKGLVTYLVYVLQVCKLYQSTPLCFCVYPFSVNTKPKGQFSPWDISSRIDTLTFTEDHRASQSESALK